MSVAGLLNLTCRVRPATETQNATTGGITYTFPDANARPGVRCAIQTMNSTEGVLQDSERSTRVYNVYFNHGESISTKDIIDQISPGTEWSGRTLAMHSGPTDDAGRKAYVRCEAVEVGGGAQL